MRDVGDQWSVGDQSDRMNYYRLVSNISFVVCTASMRHLSLRGKDCIL